MSLEYYLASRIRDRHSRPHSAASFPDTDAEDALSDEQSSFGAKSFNHSETTTFKPLQQQQLPSKQSARELEPQIILVLEGPAHRRSMLSWKPCFLRLVHDLKVNDVLLLFYKTEENMVPFKKYSLKQLITPTDTEPAELLLTFSTSTLSSKLMLSSSTATETLSFDSQSDKNRWMSMITQQSQMLQQRQQQPAVNMVDHQDATLSMSSIASPVLSHRSSLPMSTVKLQNDQVVQEQLKAQLDQLAQENQRLLKYLDVMKQNEESTKNKAAAAMELKEAEIQQLKGRIVDLESQLRHEPKYESVVAVENLNELEKLTRAGFKNTFSALENKFHELSTDVRALETLICTQPLKNMADETEKMDEEHLVRLVTEDVEQVIASLIVPKIDELTVLIRDAHLNQTASVPNQGQSEADVKLWAAKLEARLGDLSRQIAGLQPPKLPAKQSQSGMANKSVKAIGHSLEKMTEYLSKSVDIQNKSDAQLYKRLDDLSTKLGHLTNASTMAGSNKTNKDTVDKEELKSTLEGVKLELVGLSRKLAADQLNMGEQTKQSERVVSDRLDQLTKICQDLKQGHDRLMMKQSAGVKEDSTVTAGLSNDLKLVHTQLRGIDDQIRVLNNKVESGKKSKLDDVVKIDSHQLDELFEKVSEIAARLDIAQTQLSENQQFCQVEQFQSVTKPSGDANTHHFRIRSSSPTKFTAYENYSVINHLLELQSSVASLRHQISDLELHSDMAHGLKQTLPNPVLAKLEQSVAELHSRLDHSESIEEIKTELGRISGVLGPKIEMLAEEMEQLQCGLQSEMVNYSKSLQDMLMDREAVLLENERLKRQLEVIRLTGDI